MLNNPIFQLNNSKLRKKLFLYFFNDVNRRRYVREIAKIIKVDPTNLSKELKKLQEMGIFLSETSGHQKYFYLNKNYPLFTEMQATINKTIGSPALLKDFFKNIPGIKYAFIYGSVAKGTEKSHSDVDVCLIVDKNIFNQDSILEGIAELEEKIGREISYIFRTEKEWKNVTNQNDSFTFGLKKGKKIELIKNEKS
ncbi:MAG: nucleotidyltransferase domain-containing protein [Elusimicrobiota bacterium]